MADLFKKIKGTIKVYWIPVNAGALGTERANQLALGAYYRAPSNGDKNLTAPESSPQVHLKDHKKSQTAITTTAPSSRLQVGALYTPPAK